MLVQSPEKLLTFLLIPPDKKIPEGKPSSQNNRKWAWLACVIGAALVFRGPSSGRATVAVRPWPRDRKVCGVWPGFRGN